MRLILALTALTFAATASAQAPACDVKYVTDINTATNDVTTATAEIYGMPVADLDDNTKKSMRVVDLASRLQDKGGPYEVEVGEWRTCNGVTVKNPANAIMVKGVTHKGMNQINRMALKVAGEIQDRYDHRAEKGHKEAWDHGKARKFKRDDLGRKVKD